MNERPDGTGDPARRLRPFDWALLLSLLPLFGVCLGIHLANLGEVGPAFFVSGPEDAYPRVAGSGAELPQGASPVRVGDRL